MKNLNVLVDLLLEVLDYRQRHFLAKLVITNHIFVSGKWMIVGYLYNSSDFSHILGCNHLSTVRLFIASLFCVKKKLQ